MRDNSMDHKRTTPATQTQARDPFAMDIDASRAGPSGRTREDFNKAMRGRCYGCGSKEHVKRNGNHQSSKCGFCQRNGHWESVCQDKFMGLDRNRGLTARSPQRITAIDTTPFTLFPTEPVTTIAATPAPTPYNPAAEIATLQATIAEQNRLLSLITANANQNPGF